MSVSFKTTDGLTISANDYRHADADPNHCLLIMPGFAQHSSTPRFRHLSETLAQPSHSHRPMNVVCLDARGTGQSEGRFGFGLSEYLDIEAVLRSLRQRFERIDLLGFSLGAYSSLRVTAETDAAPDRLLLVSCPTSVNHIIWGGALLSHSATTLLNRSQRRNDRDVGFKWGFPLSRKPDARDFASKSRAPEIHFLIGELDRLVPPAMSQSVFERLAPERKTSWTAIKDGRHAELLCVSHAAEFRNWINND